MVNLIEPSILCGCRPATLDKKKQLRNDGLTKAVQAGGDSDGAHAFM